jgi:hypothetical protein
MYHTVPGNTVCYKMLYIVHFDIQGTLETDTVGVTDLRVFYIVNLKVLGFSLK